MVFERFLYHFVEKINKSLRLVKESESYELHLKVKQSRLNFQVWKT
jgi:hypothetical protein